MFLTILLIIGIILLTGVITALIAFIILIIAERILSQKSWVHSYDEVADDGIVLFLVLPFINIIFSLFMLTCSLFDHYRPTRIIRKICEKLDGK